jgi:hypothetical protein
MYRRGVVQSELDKKKGMTHVHYSTYMRRIPRTNDRRINEYSTAYTR